MTHKERRDRETSNRRLLKLAAKLRTVDKDHFRYSRWGGVNESGVPDVCGTNGCAIGWASTMPEFRRLGLRLVSGSGAKNDWDQPTYPRLAGYETSGLEGTWDEAAMHVFKLSKDEAQFLFLPNDRSSSFVWKAPGPSASPIAVAEHIERFVAERGS